MSDNQLDVLFDRSAELSAIVTLPVVPAIASVPTGRTLQSLKKLLDEYLLRPERRQGYAGLQDLKSFIDWTNRHKDGASVLRCHQDRTMPALQAIIDYHEAGAPAAMEGADGKARWKGFGANYTMPLDQRWKDWTGISGKPIGQAQFASFLEDHVLDLVGPNTSVDGAGALVSTLPPEVARFLALNGGKCAEPADVVALSRGLEVYADTKVAERVNMQSGETSFTFEEKHRGAPDAVVVPQIFLLALPVFYLSDTMYRVPVRLRYRLADGKVLWLPTLWQAEEIFDKAVRDAATEAATDTGLPLFYGSSL